MTTGKIISMTIDGVEIRTDPVKEERRRIASTTTAEWAELYWSAPVSACTICGCAHRSPYDACNSCRAGQLAARQQLTVERLKRAGRRMAEACSSAAAHAVAMGALIKLGNLGRATPVNVIINTEIREQLHLISSVITFDEIAPVPNLPIFDSGFMNQMYGDRATRLEPRPKRDRRNRGPKQHGQWWQK